MHQNAEHLPEIKDLVKQSKQHLIGGQIHKIGELLNLSWEKKKKLSTKIQNSSIENLYKLGMEGKALGGKLLGAGGGGYFLFISVPENHVELRKKLNGFNELPFTLESSGSRVLSSSTLKSIFERPSCA
jgi:D-glycero-alpha-D-manno-heptose-7-phosphate kinase